ncbi:dipeptide ABC transporter ATP-binding protein [bacterium]|nr:dipeptide ABC transporter ATP-binding protein [bacterium]
MPLLEIKDLTLRYGSQELITSASLSIKKGSTLALVGESGSGKSLTALSIMGLQPASMQIDAESSIRFDGHELVGMPEGEKRLMRGKQMAMIFQEPMTALNPLHSIGRQIGEALLVHHRYTREQVKREVINLLKEVGLDALTERLGAYPYELSGGQRQRVMIAMAIANRPQLLIADEPTTALDVTVQAQILALLKELQQKYGMALMLITHDLGLVRRYADDVAVMKDGEVVERASVATLFAKPKHAYTKLLLAAAPKGENFNIVDESGAPLLMAGPIEVKFSRRKNLWGKTIDELIAVDGARVSIQPGEALGLVGESGSGKSMLAMALLRLVPSSGPVSFIGRRLDNLPAGELRAMRRQLQLVFQDPYGSMNPRMTVGDIILEGARLHGIGADDAQRQEMAAALLKEVGLNGDILERHPHEFSGGQRQRIALVRALILKPKLLVLDEPTSALDAATQMQMVDLFRRLQGKYGLSYLFISHDLRVIKALCHRVMVMKDGKVVEDAPMGKLFAKPKYVYTKALIDAAFPEPMDA